MARNAAKVEKCAGCSRHAPEENEAHPFFSCSCVDVYIKEATCTKDERQEEG